MKKLLVLLLSLAILFLFEAGTYAADPSFSIYPSKGVVTVGKTFTVDVLIDSAGLDIAQARATLLFDPTMVKVVKPEYNASLFCSYPTDQLSVDNKYGVVMLTGFCQTGTDTLYKTVGGADVFARVKFEVKKAGTIKLEWNHDGTNKDFMSVIMKNGSPPTNALTKKPATATYTTSGTGSTPTPTFPNTAVSFSWGALAAGILLISAGWLYLALGKRSKSKMRTVVLYD
ncbi:hypothetical protein HYV12_02565 [Candidatus Dojkabacteria bacterium]|nr:hypothetical protein [Candidatus Dojkabacteria bacterium]